MTGKAASSRRYTRRELEPAGVDRIMRKVGFTASKDVAVAGHAMLDRDNNMRRVHATYADGWRATLVIRKNGTGSLSYVKKVCSIRVTSEPRGGE